MANTIVESRIAASTDDAEEKIGTGGVTRTSTDLELTTDGSDNQLIGLRFTGLDIPPDWTKVGDSGIDQQTADISAVIQEIVDQSGWTQGNALVLNISGSGIRTAVSGL